MNSKDFIQALRKVIREEVRFAVREELSIIGETISESRNTNIKKTTVKSSNLESKPPVHYKAPVKKSYVNNPLLNDLLNETPGFTGEGPKAYLEEQINYNDYSEWPTMQRGVAPRMQSNPTAMLPTTDTEGRRVDVSKLAETESGQAVVQALTKDYSALMKAIDKKKGK